MLVDLDITSCSSCPSYQTINRALSLISSTWRLTDGHSTIAQRFKMNDAQGQTSGPPLIHQPTPRRPAFLLRKLGALVPSIPGRKPTPKQRARSAPLLRPERPDAARTNNPTPPEPQDSQSQSPGSYYSFPSFERRRLPNLLCTLCSQGRSPHPRSSKSSFTYEPQICKSSESGSCPHCGGENGRRGSGAGPIPPPAATPSEHHKPGTVRASRPYSEPPGFAHQCILGNQPCPSLCGSPLIGSPRAKHVSWGPVASHSSLHSPSASPKTRSSTPRLHHVRGLPNAQEYP